MTGSGKSNSQSGKNLDFDDEARALYERCYLAWIVPIGVTLPAGSADNLTSSCNSLFLLCFLRLNLDPNFKTSGQWNRVDPIYRYMHLLII